MRVLVPCELTPSILATSTLAACSPTVCRLRMCAHTYVSAIWKFGGADQHRGHADSLCPAPWAELAAAKTVTTSKRSATQAWCNGAENVERGRAPLVRARPRYAASGSLLRCTLSSTELCVFHGAYSHSMVPGGFDVTSSTTRLTSLTSLVMRVEIFSSTSYGRRVQSAVIASSEETGRRTIGWP